ncbi:MAG: hypothetical protein LH606_17750 [Cytophagaceae bacterium]|nr:hypothetical protein [Cytophagaceae bacterium]
MKKTATGLAKALFSSFGLFVARRRQEAVNGHELEQDLTVIVGRDHPVCFDIGANLG